MGKRHFLSQVTDPGEGLQTISIVLILLAISSGCFFISSNSSFSGELRSDHTSNPIVSGWTFPWDPDTNESLAEWAPLLDEISPYWYWTLPNGTVVDTHILSGNFDYLRTCRRENVRVIPMVSNNHNSETIEEIVRNSTLQEYHLHQLVDLVLRYNYDGLDINYESIYTKDKDHYSKFINNLSKELHRWGKDLYVSVFPKLYEDEDREGPGAYDYELIGRCSDSVRIMTYNLHWSSIAYPGPITSYEWMRKALDYAITKIDKEKITLGIPLFSYDWKVDQAGYSTSVAVNRSYVEIESITERYNLKRLWNSTARTPYLEYQEQNGQRHSLHYCDAESLLHEVSLMMEYGLMGISIWKIGGEDPDARHYMNIIQDAKFDNLPPYLRSPGDINGLRDQPIYFSPVRAYDIEGPLSSIRWDFGDGNRSTLLEPIHSYERGGFYTATIDIIDGDGISITRSREIRIAPFPKISISGIRETESELTFNATGTWDLNGIVSYSWDFGDGTYRFHDFPVSHHTYGSPGKYTIQLTVINSLGYSETVFDKIVIPDNERPIANAGSDIVVWEDQYFELDGGGSSDDSGNLTYEWTFIDDSTHHGKWVEFIILEPGTYTINLKVYDSSGLYDTDTVSVTVLDRTAPELVIDFQKLSYYKTGVNLSIGDSTDNVGIERIIWRLPGGEIILDRYDIYFDPGIAGRYYITVEIMDFEGNWNSTTVWVDFVDANEPYGSLVIDPKPFRIDETYLKDLEIGYSEYYQNNTAGLLKNTTYRFYLTEVVDDSGIGFINWTFGDGYSAGGESVYHRYQMEGQYSLIVRIKDIYGNQFAIDRTVIILENKERRINELQPYNDVYINNTINKATNEDGSNIFDISFFSIIFIITVLVVIILLTDIIRRSLFFIQITKKNRIPLMGWFNE